MEWTRHSPQLVLVYDKDTLTALRLNGSSQPLAVPLAVDPLTDEPQVVAQELRERLAPLGRLPRRVIVGVPMAGILVSAVAVPDMPAAEVPGFLRLQAEREFLMAPDEMWLGLSSGGSGTGGGRAVLAALAVRHAANLERSLRLAGFREIRIVPAAAAAAGEGTSIRLLAGGDGVELVVSVGGVVILLRRLAAGAGQPLASAEVCAALISDLRISLRQLPEGLCGSAPGVEVLGHPERVAELADALRAAPVVGALPVMAVPVEQSVPGFLCAQMARRLAAGGEPALALGPIPVARGLRGLAGWRRAAVVTAAAVGLVVFAGAGLWLYQARQLADLRARWQTLEPRVSTVRQIMDSARARQAWFSDQPVTLDLLRAITLAFPERGVVWATRIEISGRRQATVAGNASNREEWLKTLDTLRQTPGVQNLRVTQARESADGRAPMTFALSFAYAAPATGRDRREATP